MKYNVKVNESNLILSANDSKTFLEEFAKLPEGEYTVNVLSDASRSGKHYNRHKSDRVATIIAVALEGLAVLLALGCIVPLWIVACALL